MPPVVTKIVDVNHRIAFRQQHLPNLLGTAKVRSGWGKVSTCQSAKNRGNQTGAILLGQTVCGLEVDV
jgi:hypothetical protein